MASTGRSLSQLLIRALRLCADGRQAVGGPSIAGRRLMRRRRSAVTVTQPHDNLARSCSIVGTRLRKPTPASAQADPTRGRSIDVIVRAEVSDTMATTLPPRPDHPPTAGAVRARPEFGRRLLANLSTAELVEDAVRAGEGVARRRGPPRRAHRQAHRPQPARQVHRRRAVEPGPDLVGRGQPADQRGALRPTPIAPRGLLRREGPVRAGLLHRGRSGPPASPAGRDRDGLGEHLRAEPVPPPGRGPR